MKFRTQFAAVAAVAALVGLAACGGGDDDEASSGTSTTTDTSGAGAPEATPHPAGHSDSMITMSDQNTFSPASLTVAPGTEIMVMNPGSVRHDLKDEATKGKTFDSGDINGGENGSITAPDKSGDYPYLCTYHFGMKGTIKVK